MPFASFLVRREKREPDSNDDDGKKTLTKRRKRTVRCTTSWQRIDVSEGRTRSERRTWSIPISVLMSSENFCIGKTNSMDHRDRSSCFLSIGLTIGTPTRSDVDGETKIKTNISVRRKKLARNAYPWYLNKEQQTIVEIFSACLISFNGNEQNRTRASLELKTESFFRDNYSINHWSAMTMIRTNCLEERLIFLSIAMILTSCHVSINN